MTSPFNTSKHPNPEWLRGGDPDAIVQQEADGQKEMLRATTLPSSMGAPRETYEELGFEFGEIVRDDPMFIEAKLPEGWEKRPTDHSMWSEIVDTRGIRRVAVFYKAAFYDRAAHMYPTSPGHETVRQYLYGDTDTIDTELLEKLTVDELVCARQEIASMRKHILEYPEIYSKHQKRLDNISAVIS